MWRLLEANPEVPCEICPEPARFSYTTHAHRVAGPTSMNLASYSPIEPHTIMTLRCGPHAPAAQKQFKSRA